MTMTAQQTHTTDDSSVRQTLRNSYDAMTPDEETIDRMWSRIAAYQSDAVASSHASSASAAPVVPFEEVKKKRGFRYELVGSIAACLIVLCGVGAYLLLQPPHQDGTTASSPVFGAIADIAASTTSSSLTTGSSSTAPAAVPGSSSSAITASSASDSPAVPLEQTPSTSPGSSVVLDSGQQLVLVTTDSSDMVEANTDLVSKEISSGTVYSTVTPDGTSCIAFEYGDDDDTYAVQIDGAPGFYLAVLQPEDADESDTSSSSDDEYEDSVTTQGSSESDGAIETQSTSGDDSADSDGDITTQSVSSGDGSTSETASFVTPEPDEPESSDLSISTDELGLGLM